MNEFITDTEGTESLTPQEMTGPVEPAEVPGGGIDPASIADSTSIEEIQILATGHEADLLGDEELHDELTEYVANALTDETSGDHEKLEAGKGLLSRFILQHDKAWSGVQATFTSYAIKIGKALNVMKKLAKNSGHRWEEWAEENITFIKERARMEYMLLAARTDAHGYAWIGKQKLMLLINATKKVEGTDPIGTFLTEHGILILLT